MDCADDFELVFGFSINVQRAPDSLARVGASLGIHPAPSKSKLVLQDWTKVIPDSILKWERPTQNYRLLYLGSCPAKDGNMRVYPRLRWYALCWSTYSIDLTLRWNWKVVRTSPERTLSCFTFEKYCVCIWLWHALSVTLVRGMCPTAFWSQLRGGSSYRQPWPSKLQWHGKTSSYWLLKMSVSLMFAAIDMWAAPLGFDGVTEWAMCRLRTGRWMPVQKMFCHNEPDILYLVGWVTRGAWQSFVDHIGLCFSFLVWTWSNVGVSRLRSNM